MYGRDEVSVFLSIFAVGIGSILGLGSVLVWLSSRLDRGRIVFAAAEKALSQCASNWTYEEGNYFKDGFCEGLGFTISGNNPFSLSVRYGGASTKAGFGWSIRLSLMALGMTNEKDKMRRLDTLLAAMHKMEKEGTLP